MANILGIFDPQDTINASSGGNVLAITDPVETIEFQAGLEIAITAPLDVISIHGITAPNYLQIDIPVDSISISGLTGEIGGVSLSDPLQTFSGHGYAGVLGALSLFDPLATVSMSGTSGVAIIGVSGNLSLVDPVATVSMSGTPGVVIVGVSGDISLRDPLATVSMSGTSGIVAIDVSGNLSFVDPLDQIGISGSPGAIGSIAIIDPLVTIALQGLPASVGVLAIEDPLATISIYGREIPVTYLRKAIVMNLSSYAVSHYVNFNFNSLAHFKGVFLGTNEQGLFILGGKDDLLQPIQSEVQMGIYDSASDGVMKFPKEAWFSYRSDGQMELDVEVEENKSPYAYVFDKSASRITESRKTLGKGFRQRFYTFILKNRSGSDFDIESLRILGDVISRKRR